MGANSEKSFNSKFTELGQFALNVKNEDIKKEPMFFNASLEFAYYTKGATIARSFINSLPHDWLCKPLVFDSRIHMLMPGWYPSIPGWHHDDVPRPEIPVGQHFISAGQPEYDSPKYLSEHILGLVNADVCPTKFASGNCVMPKVEDNETVYKKWHPEVERLIENGSLRLDSVKDRTLYHFDWQTFHTGTKAVSNGWRWFGRVSRNTDRLKTITNEIRVNAQVYLEFPMEGW
jgi:hypothetical protein